MVKFKFADAAKEAEGFVALAKRLRVICLPDNTYEIAKSGWKFSTNLGLNIG
jgi:hypothetical protein